MRRVAAGATVLAALAGCTREAPTQADVEDCLRDTGADVTRPAPPQRTAALLPPGTRYVARASWGGDRGTADLFASSDEPTAREAQGRLRTGLADAGIAPDAVKRDETWVVVTEATEREAEAAFECIR